MLAAEEPTGDRAPHKNAKLLIDGDGNELVFGLARLQRVVDLLRHERHAAVAARDLHRLHHVPAGVVRAADVTHLAGAHETVERLHRLFERGQAVPLMHLVEVDETGAETPEARLAFADEVPAGEAAIVRAITHPKAGLGCDQHAVPALRSHRLAEHFFGPARGIDV